MKLEEKLVSLRKSKGLSQLKLAEMMDVSRQAISRWEVGSAVPSTENLKYLAGLYEITVDDLLNDETALIQKREEITGRKEKRVSKSTIIKVVIAVLFSAMLLFAHIAINKETEDTVSIDEMENVQWEISTAEEFGVEW